MRQRIGGTHPAVGCEHRDLPGIMDGLNFVAQVDELRALEFGRNASGELVHRKDGHPVCHVVGEPLGALGGPDLIGEGAAPGHDEDPPLSRQPPHRVERSLTP